MTRDADFKQLVRARMARTGESYASARSYMFRLEPADLEEVSQLAKIAAQTNLAPDQFRNRFGYLAGVR